MLIGFKFERLPKFCFRCGVIYHGVEGCLKRSTLRNQEITQFGPWLRANSTTDSTKFAQPMLEERQRRDGYNGRKDRDRKRRDTNSSEEELVGDGFQGSQPSQAGEGENGISGVNRGHNDGTFHVDSQDEQERNFVGVMRDHFENQSTPFTAPCNKSKDGKNLGGVKIGVGVEIFPNEELQLSPAGSTATGYGDKMENLFQPPMAFKGMIDAFHIVECVGNRKGNQNGKSKGMQKEKQKFEDLETNALSQLSPGVIRRNEGNKGRKNSKQNLGPLGRCGTRGPFSSLRGSNYTSPMLADVAKTMREAQEEKRATRCRRMEDQGRP